MDETTGMLISSVDFTLEIPPKMRGIFPNEDWLIIPMKAGEPTEVPIYVHEYLLKNKPRTYTDANATQRVRKPKPVVLEPKPVIFDAEKWLTENYASIAEAIKTLDTEQRKVVMKELGLRYYHKQSDDRISERIIQDVKVRVEQQEKLSKNQNIQKKGEE